jgi:hypothetical protein
MITTPNRLADVTRALEGGEPVDYRRVAALQALDLASAGRRFAEQAVADQEAEDARLADDFGVARRG